MPDRSTHATAGVLAGIGAGTVSARNLPAEHLAIEVLAAAVGGYLGGIAPDVLEPSLSPNHRDLFHSFIVGGTVGAAAFAEWQADCRAKAGECDARAMAAPPDSDARRHEAFKALCWRLLAGFLVGFVAGYLSHLALDAATPRSLPLIVRGF
jgi:inner membrane protein